MMFYIGVYESVLYFFKFLFQYEQTIDDAEF